MASLSRTRNARVSRNQRSLRRNTTGRVSRHSAESVTVVSARPLAAPRLRMARSRRRRRRLPDRLSRRSGILVFFANGRVQTRSPAPIHQRLRQLLPLVAHQSSQERASSSKSARLTTEAGCARRATTTILGRTATLCLKDHIYTASRATIGRSVGSAWLWVQRCLIDHTGDQDQGLRQHYWLQSRCGREC